MSDELSGRLDVLENVVLGDPKNLKSNPGVVAELSRTSFELSRTNEMLADVKADISKIRGDLGRVNWMFIGLIATAIGNLILKG